MPAIQDVTGINATANVAAATPDLAPAAVDGGGPTPSTPVTGFADAIGFDRTGDRLAVEAKLSETLATVREQAGRGEFSTHLAEQCFELAGKLGRGIRPEIREAMLTAMQQVVAGREASFYETLVRNLDAATLAGDFGEEISGPLAALRARLPELCAPQRLDTSYWAKNRSLTIQEATTRRYVCTWAVNHRTWEFNIPPDGWISDCFIHANGSTAVVHWHVASGQVRVSPAGGKRVDQHVARSCAEWARKTIFPGVRLETLTFSA